MTKMTFDTSREFGRDDMIKWLNANQLKHPTSCDSRDTCASDEKKMQIMNRADCHVRKGVVSHTNRKAKKHRQSRSRDIPPTISESSSRHDTDPAVQKVIQLQPEWQGNHHSSYWRHSFSDAEDGVKDDEDAAGLWCSLTRLQCMTHH